MTPRFTPLEPAEAAAHDDVTSEIEFFAQNSERLITDLLQNHKQFAQYCAETGESIKQEAEHFDQLVPPKRSNMVRKFYKQLKAYSPKAYQELKVYRTALGQLQPDNYRDNIVPLHQRIKEQLDERTRGHETNLSDGQIYQRCVNALYQAVLPALIAELMTSDPNSGIDPNKLPKNRVQLYLRFSHMYLRLLHASGDDPAWKQLNPESDVPYQQNYNACFSLIHVRSLNLPSEST